MYIFVSQVVNYGTQALNCQTSKITISSSEEGPPTAIKSSFERKIVVKQGNVTETTQLSWSFETCVER